MRSDGVLLGSSFPQSQSGLSEQRVMPCTALTPSNATAKISLSKYDLLGWRDFVVFLFYFEECIILFYLLQSSCYQNIAAYFINDLILTIN